MAWPGRARRVLQPGFAAIARDCGVCGAKWGSEMNEIVALWGKWVTFSPRQSDRGGGAPPTPPPRSAKPFAKTGHDWPSAAPSSSRWTQRTASRFRRSSGPRCPRASCWRREWSAAWRSGRRRTTRRTSAPRSRPRPVSPEAREHAALLLRDSLDTELDGRRPRDDPAASWWSTRASAARSSVTGAGDCLEIWDRETLGASYESDAGRADRRR